jgi:hypothetical protein
MGNRRRSAASLSSARVSCFSFTSNFCRAFCQTARETMAGSAVDFLLFVFIGLNRLFSNERIDTLIQDKVNGIFYFLVQNKKAPLREVVKMVPYIEPYTNPF